MQDKSLKPKILIYAYWKLAKAGNSNSYRTLHCKHWSSVRISEWLHDCATSFFQKTIISGGSLASQNSKVEAWNSRLDPSVSKLLCQQSHCWTPFTDKISNRLGLSDITYSIEYSQRLTLESWFTNLQQMPLNHSWQLPAPYKQLIDGLKQNWPWENDGTTNNLTNNTQVFNCDNRGIEMHQWHYEST